jgi:hypothetical protein
LLYALFGGCPLTWNGFSIEAFSGLWEFTKLSAASGVMIWYLVRSPQQIHRYYFRSILTN